MSDRMTRRTFLGTAAAAGALLAGQPKAVAVPPAKKRFKVGLIGCGGRGNGALGQHVKAAKILNDALNLGIEIQVSATADWFKSKAEGTGGKYNVPKSRCFGGATAYRELVESDVDIVLMATPPAFRPVHFEAAVEAGKHVFMEKPVAVDPPGCRRVIETGEVARKKDLMVIAGTQRRHQKGYMEAQAAVSEGAIGKILSGRVSWCANHMFARSPINPKSPGDVVASWKDWVHLSGDHITEQHVHNLDVMIWFLGTHPMSAVGFGGRAQRNAGTQYDFFSVDFEFPDDVFIHSMCRQVNECWRWVGEQLRGQTGVTRCGGGLVPQKSVVLPEIPQQRSGHQQEHINMLYHLVKGKHINEARNVSWATACAVMGRHAAYTGKKIEWRDMMENPKRNPELYNLTLRPTAEDYEKGDVEIPKENVIPHAGKPPSERQRRRRTKKA